MLSWAGILTLVFWAIVVLLVAIVYAIARFYQATSGQPSHYRWFIVPMVLLGAGAVRSAVWGDFANDALGDGLILGGGVSLIALAVWLRHLMMGGRRR
ncbi:MAG TPA: hypothetical protein VIK33_17060 [Anaerolineae bacterium]